MNDPFDRPNHNSQLDGFVGSFNHLFQQNDISSAPSQPRVNDIPAIHQSFTPALTQPLNQSPAPSDSLFYNQLDNPFTYSSPVAYNTSDNAFTGYNVWSRAEEEFLAPNDSDVVNPVPVDLSFLNSSSTFPARDEPSELNSFDHFRNDFFSSGFNTSLPSSNVRSGQSHFTDSAPIQQSELNLTLPVQLDRKSHNSQPSFADVAKQKPRSTTVTQRPIAPVQPRQRDVVKIEGTLEPSVQLPRKTASVTKQAQFFGAYGLDDFDDPGKESLPVATVEPSVTRRSSESSLASSTTQSIQSKPGSATRKNKTKGETRPKGGSSSKAVVPDFQHDKNVLRPGIRSTRDAVTKETLNNVSNGKNEPHLPKPLNYNNNLCDHAESEGDVHGAGSGQPMKHSVKMRRNIAAARRKSRKPQSSNESNVDLGRMLDEAFNSVVRQACSVRARTCNMLFVLWMTLRHWVLAPVMRCTSGLEPQLSAMWAYLRPLLFTVDEHACIELPDSSETLITRLLGWNPPDVYRLLGAVRSAPTEELTVLYKQQAALVHPDTSTIKGGIEAFLLLTTAFNYIVDSEQSNAEEAESLIIYLHERLKQARDLLPCAGCEGSHVRCVVERPLYEARLCSQCECKHAVREGDVWAETSWYGLRWQYFMCMEGRVYDITTWADCEQGRFNRIKQNAHQIYLKVDIPTHDPEETMRRLVNARAVFARTNSTTCDSPAQKPSLTLQRRVRRRKR